jgi:hypothetical protein
MPRFRAEVQMTFYIELNAVDEEIARDSIQDYLSFTKLAEDATAFLDRNEIVRIKEIVREQSRCGVCDSSRWSDVNGCAECGNLNDRWRE